MGLTESKNVTDITLTKNRFRSVCQRKPMDQVERWRIEALANDIQKVVGVHIPVETATGKQLKVGTICDNIRKLIPDPEKVCMFSERSKSKSKKNIINLVDHYNKTYGSNISPYENPLDKSSPVRSMNALCDDIYMVADRVRRQMSDDSTFVKASLNTEIRRLQDLQTVLNSQFSQLQNKLNTTTKGDYFSDAKQKINEAMALKESLDISAQDKKENLQQLSDWYHKDYATQMLSSDKFVQSATDNLKKVSKADAQAPSPDTYGKATGGALVKLTQCLGSHVGGTHNTLTNMGNKVQSWLTTRHTEKEKSKMRNGIHALSNLDQSCAIAARNLYNNLIGNYSSNSSMTGGSISQNAINSILSCEKLAEASSPLIMGGKRKKRSSKKRSKRSSKRRSTRKSKGRSKRRSKKRVSRKRR